MPDGLEALLVHPTRRRLLLEYAAGPDTPGRIAKRIGEALNNVAYHTIILARHGYVELVRTERHRGALTHWYRSTVGPIIDDTQWESLPLPLRRTLALEVLDQLAGASRRAAVDGSFDHDEAHLSRFPLELDQQGVRDVVRVLHEVDVALARIAADAHGRCADGCAPHQIAILSFEPAPEPAAVGEPRPPGRPRIHT